MTSTSEASPCTHPTAKRAVSRANGVEVIEVEECTVCHDVLDTNPTSAGEWLARPLGPIPADHPDPYFRQLAQQQGARL